MCTLTGTRNYDDFWNSNGLRLTLTPVIFFFCVELQAWKIHLFVFKLQDLLGRGCAPNFEEFLLFSFFFVFFFFFFEGREKCSLLFTFWKFKVCFPERTTLKYCVTEDPHKLYHVWFSSQQANFMEKNTDTERKNSSSRSGKELLWQLLKCSV